MIATIIEGALGGAERARTELDKPSLWGLTPDGLSDLGCPGEVRHIFRKVQRPWGWSAEFPAIPKAAAEFILVNTDVSLPLMVEQVVSVDETTKVLFALADGARVEAVHIPALPKQGGAAAGAERRVTLCISSQVGCAMGCTFCATGRMGLRRDLSAGEVVGQVVAAMHALGPLRAHRLNVVFMGMGEPLANLDAVEQALTVLCHPDGLGIASRRITVSTSGLVPGIARLGAFPLRPRLALSLNATTDEARSALMPVGRRWDLAALREALRAWPVAHRERITLAYVLMAGVNDTDADADRLAVWAEGLPVLVNLIPHNAIEPDGHEASGDERVRAFADRLAQVGCRVKVRARRGADVDGACGQLAVGMRG